MKLFLARPSGFCAGVQRAVDTVQRSLQQVAQTVHVRHEIVHNRHVVEALRRQGAVFVDELAQVPEGAHVIFSAHGVGRRIRAEAKEKNLQVVDATCPLVRKVHTEIQRYHQQGMAVILVGDANHPEVQGSADQSDGELHIVRTVPEAKSLMPKNVARLAFVTQTTLSVDDSAQVVAVLRARFPHISSPNSADICYAAQNRQAAVKLLAEHTRHIIVVGSANSSNAKGLRTVAERAGCRAILLDEPSALPEYFLADASSVGVAAAASSPQSLIDQFVAYLKTLGVSSVEELVAVPEQMNFPLPPMPEPSLVLEA